MGHEETRPHKGGKDVQMKESLRKQPVTDKIFSRQDFEDAVKQERERIAKDVREFLIGQYLVTSGDKYRLNDADHAKLALILKGIETSSNGEPLSSPHQAEGYPAEVK